ncbi:MAG TPA: hypothetical protein GX528_07655 [Firmicutes bacterium]|nr:hypothetical protein [Bacillota bacterium]
MKSFQRLPTAAAVLIVFLAVFLFPLWAAAKTIEPEPRAEEEAVDFAAKYEEILGEITISEEASQVVDKIKQAVTELQDLTADVCQTQYKGSQERSEKVEGKLAISLVEHLVARLEFSAPSALRGQIIVIDQEKNEARSYMPVTNQITVQGLEGMGEEALSFLDVTDVATLFDFTQYEVVVLESIEKDGLWDYSLQVSGYEDQVLQVRVKSDSWVPYEILEFSGGKLKGKLELRNAVFNQALSRDEIRGLPDVKEFRL